MTTHSKKVFLSFSFFSIICYFDDNGRVNVLDIPFCSLMETIDTVLKFKNPICHLKINAHFKIRQNNLWYVFFEVRFFGSFGKLAVQAAQFLAVYGRQVCVGILGSNFFSRPRFVVNSYCLLLDELRINIRYCVFTIEILLYLQAANRK